MPFLFVFSFWIPIFGRTVSLVFLCLDHDPVELKHAIILIAPVNKYDDNLLFNTTPFQQLIMELCEILLECPF